MRKGTLWRNCPDLCDLTHIGRRLRVNAGLFTRRLLSHKPTVRNVAVRNASNIKQCRSSKNYNDNNNNDLSQINFFIKNESGYIFLCIMIDFIGWIVLWLKCTLNPMKSWGFFYSRFSDEIFPEVLNTISIVTLPNLRSWSSKSAHL